MTTDIPKSPALLALQDERQLIRVKLKADQAALDRAERNVSDWTSQQTTVEREAAMQEAADIERLTAWISEGEPMAKSPAMPDETLTIRLAHVRLNLIVAVKAQASLQATVKATTDKLAAIEAAVAAEADKLLIARREALAEKVEEAFSGFRSAVEALRTLCPDHLHTPVNVSLLPPSSRVSAALALLPHLEDGLNTPVNILRGGLNSAAPWMKLRSELIEGTLLS